MTTIFDLVTVGCFIAMVAVFFLLTDRETGTLLRFLLSGIAFAVANQVGNAGLVAIATVLVVAGLGNVLLNIPRDRLPLL